jgi:hypothetical protein
MLRLRRRSSVTGARRPASKAHTTTGPLVYVPVDELGDQPHVMVDGAARPGTVATLSHWPRSPTPTDLRRDLSAQIVVRSLETGYLDGLGVDVATIDHYDEDGVIALGLLAVAGLVDAHADVLIEAARVGDFGVVRDRRAALVAFSLASLADPLRTPIDSLRANERPKANSLEACGIATDHALGILADLARDPLQFEELWHDEFAAFEAGTSGLGRWANIEDLPDHDLAIVHVDPEAASDAASEWGGDVIHRAAVSSATSRLRVATIAGNRMEVRFRYESWVRMVSLQPRPRVDLSRLAAALDELEPAQARWHFDGASATRPVLHTIGRHPSGIPPDVFVEQLVEQLATLDAGPPAWDPYA